jgi:hypothetical protein
MPRKVLLWLLRAGIWLLFGRALVALSLLLPGVRNVPGALILFLSWYVWGGDSTPGEPVGWEFAIIVCSGIFGLASWASYSAIRRRSRK